MALLTIDGDTVVIGALHADDTNQSAGAAYAFVRTGSTWAQQQKLLAGDGIPYDMGRSVSISGNTAIVGAADTDNNTGSAYVFIHSGALWSQQQKLLASDATPDDHFGQSVTISGDTAVVGAYQDDDNGQNSGSGYVFVRSGATWIQQQKLLPSNGVAQAGSGISVAIKGDMAVVGGLGNDDNGQPAVAAYVFVRSGATWAEQHRLFVSDGAPIDNFGVSVPLAGNTALVGVRYDDETGQDAGAVHVFALGLSTGEPCTTNPACASGLCFNGICAAPAASCASLANGTPCDDGNPCTQQDTCQTSVCLGEEFALCSAPPAAEVCQQAVCFPSVAACGVWYRLDGAPCPGGVCIAGGCYVEGATSSASASGVGGSATGSGGMMGTSTSTAAAMSATTGTGAGVGTGGSVGTSGSAGEISLQGGACGVGRGSASGAPWIGLGLVLALRRRRYSVRGGSRP